MPKVGVYKYRDIEKTLRGLGCFFVSQKGGSHQTRSNREGRLFIVHKVHGHDVMKKGTFLSMLKCAEISFEEFMSEYQK